MNQALTIKDALHIAISEEIKAYNLYTRISEQVSSAGAKAMLTELAAQEKAHQQFLESLVKQDDIRQLGEAIPRQSMGIAEFLAPSKPLDENASIQEVMIFAIKEEEKANKFYIEMQAQFAGTEAEAVFRRLADEEQGHKIKLEQEYEDAFFKEN